MSRSPSAVDQQDRAFRDCMGTFPTGVTVVTARHGDDAAGMTVNSFTSVSLDPMRVLVCLAHGSRTLAAVRDTERLTISVLANGQEETALAFARPHVPFPWEHVHQERAGFLPVVGAVAVLRCDVDTRMEVGDHDVVVGAVHGFEAGDEEPLAFCRGTFGAFVSEQAPQVARSAS
ncbi:flavin reductase [Egibacter rhizosphaerae]|uniref:Flavin reductase n=1 Tax=Egibacter rhizosphaerae TaxID=1670831 RepID=A0A411YH18_9ACTN|nr:flavin reductase family protein [Egibacter rhizosphaerae]QBI20372.1 flavin reductase [Egibacter rhizosphaerae]